MSYDLPPPVRIDEGEGCMYYYGNGERCAADPAWRVMHPTNDVDPLKDAIVAGDICTTHLASQLPMMEHAYPVLICRLKGYQP